MFKTIKNKILGWFFKAEVNFEELFKGPNVLSVSKVALPVKFVVSKKAGSVQTLENKKQPYDAGYIIITGVKGEKYPVDPKTFEKIYINNGDGTATPKPIMKLAIPAVGEGVIHTPWGQDLAYKEGEDMIIRHGTDDYGVVKNEVFKTTYQVHNKR